MDLINRYVYAVIKNLPEKQREDIERELRTLIYDMVEEFEGTESYERKVKEALLGLGDPEALADNYRGYGRYLIGPQYYDKYLQVLKIFMGAIFIGVSIALTLGNIFSNNQNIIYIFSGYLGALFSALLQGFTFTTIGFAIAERQSMNIIRNNAKKDEWTLADLPIVPEKKAKISPVEPIFSIIFYSVFMAIFYLQPQLFAAYIPNPNGAKLIPVFNLEVLFHYKLLLIFIFIFTILKEVLKFMSKRWTLKLAINYITLSLMSTILMLVVFTNPGIWNPDFSTEIMKATNLDFNFASVWLKITTGFIIAIVLVSILEIATALYKGIKYNIIK